MARITLKQLEALLAVDQTLHFRRAAELCGITQPSLSAQIQGLEESLGVRLIDRSRSAVAVTPLGREIVDRARRISRDVQDLVDYTEGARSGLSGTVRLGTTPTIGPYLLPFVVSALHKAYKDLRLYIREGASRDLDEGLERGVHDVLLTHLPAGSSQFTERVILREPMYVVMATDHPLAAKDAITPTDLSGQDILTLSQDHKLFDQIKGICEAFDANLVQDYEGTSLDALRQMVGMGMGLTFLPALYVRSEIRARSEVVYRPLKGRVLRRPIGLVWRKSAGRYEAYDHLADVTDEVVKTRLKDIG